jgi:molecular chaperone GrpE
VAEKQQKQPQGESQAEQEAPAGSQPETGVEAADSHVGEKGEVNPPEVSPPEAGEAGAADVDQPGMDTPGGEEEQAVPLEDLLAQLQEELAVARDGALRAQADAQNVKRRAEQDVEKARKFALEQFTKDLLPVVDNLERALEAASGDDEAVRPIAEGVKLTLKSFLDVMKKFNIELVDPQGEPFDPNLHQAMSMVENNEVEPNSVITVVQKGYTLNGRLVRPAMVIVSKNGT